MKRRLALFLASGCYLGLIPGAPGTYAAVAATSAEWRGNHGGRPAGRSLRQSRPSGNQPCLSKTLILLGTEPGKELTLEGLATNSTNLHEIFSLSNVSVPIEWQTDPTRSFSRC